MGDPLNAFVPGPRCRVDGAVAGPLAGLTCAVKDLIDVAGWPTGGGNPDWERTHPVPTEHAWVVDRLLPAGASIISKTATDEISLGILGENAFCGTPRNPAAPDRVPGGAGGSPREITAVTTARDHPNAADHPVFAPLLGRGRDLDLLAVARAFGS